MDFPYLNEDLITLYSENEKVKLKPISLWRKEPVAKKYTINNGFEVIG